jgi:class 3 adenylate cyclase
VDTAPQHGYLVLADISGYTSFVAGTELTHAQEILTELLELIVEHFRGLLTISKLEGDAVFAYAPDQRLPRGETLLELVEVTYAAFRNRRDGVQRRTTCECRACRAIPTLDLKFIVHHGEYLAQRVSGIHELVGSDVNLAHRLLKNHVADATGWRAYALFTQAALAHMQLQLAEAQAMPETYEHLGTVLTFSLDLHPRYADLSAARRVTVEAADADLTDVLDYPAPPAVVWTWLNDPQKRVLWGTMDEVRPVLQPGGRSGPGARNHCMHGKNAVVQDILDWRPFDYYTQRDMSGPLLFTFRLTPLPAGTRLTVHARLERPLPAALRRVLLTAIFRALGVRQVYEKLGRLLAAEAALPAAS